MSKIILDNLPSTFIDMKFDLGKTNLDFTNKNILLNTIEYLEDYIYASEREKEQIEYVEEKDVLNLISEYK